MKTVYQFSVITGASKTTARDLDLIKSLGMPLDVTALSKIYDDEDECMRDCIHFVNAQNKHLPEQFQTAVESNPYLSGEHSEMSKEHLEYHAKRWQPNEILKVIAFAPKEIIPIYCSIFKSKTADGLPTLSSTVSNQ